MIAIAFGILCLLGALAAAGFTVLALGFASEPNAPTGLIAGPAALSAVLALAGIGLITGW